MNSQGQEITPFEPHPFAMQYASTPYRHITDYLIKFTYSPIKLAKIKNEKSYVDNHAYWISSGTLSALPRKILGSGHQYKPLIFPAW